MSDALQELRDLMASTPSREVGDRDAIEKLLSKCWEEIAGTQGGMKGEKLLRRTANMNWQPPRLTFEIERHGATVQGSSRAEIQTWDVDVDKGTAIPSSDFRYRQLRPREAAVDVRPIATEIVALILAGKEDPRIKWRSATRVQVLMGKILPKASVVKQTLAGRRRRLRDAMDEALAPYGWKRINAHTYEKPS